MSHIAPWQNNSVEIPPQANILLQMWCRQLLWCMLTVDDTRSTTSYRGCHGHLSGTNSKPRSIAIILFYDSMLSNGFVRFSYFYIHICTNICYSCHITIFVYITMTSRMCLQYRQQVYLVPRFICIRYNIRNWIVIFQNIVFCFILKIFRVVEFSDAAKLTALYGHMLHRCKWVLTCGRCRHDPEDPFINGILFKIKRLD